MYRPAEKRSKDWDEIYNFDHVRKGLRVQAARCMDCGVPFCQSSHGCPLGNIIPKWNDLVFHNNWSEALNQLLQTNNFPGQLHQFSAIRYELVGANMRYFLQLCTFYCTFVRSHLICLIGLLLRLHLPYFYPQNLPAASAQRLVKVPAFLV